jgi:uncharacterized protein YvpB
MTSRKKIFIGAIAVILTGLALSFVFKKENNRPIDNIIQESTPIGPVPVREEKNNFNSSQSASSSSQNSNSVSGNALLSVPFLSQAPFGVWDPLHEDACEEASLIMVKHFLNKDKNLLPTSGDVEIRKMIQYEEKNSYSISLTLEQLNQIAKDYAEMQTGRVKNNATADDIKKELDAGRPIIVPAAGKILPNPNFRNGGPNYHMLVVVGYDQKGFITNDPGTRKGEGFRYTFNDLYYAIHDWDAGNILNGQKAYLVFD